MPPARQPIVRRALLLALLAAFAGTLVWERPAPEAHGMDGAYYVHLAQHVAGGRGLVTRVSLYMQGLRELPQPATAYPLWPLLLGGVGAVTSVDVAARVLPPLCALLALALLYVLANDVARSMGVRDAVAVRLGPVPITFGHLAAAVLAFSAPFRETALVPLTEPLALLLAFAALAALGRALRGLHGGYWACASGALAGAAYLARFQMAPLAVVLPIALLLPGGRRRRASLALAAIGGVAVVVLPWLVRLTTITGRLDARLLLDFAAHRETDGLPPGPTVPADTRLGTMVARALDSGWRSFVPGQRRSYVEIFGPIAWSVPLALLLALARRRSGQGPAPPTDDAVLPVAVVLAALGMLAPLHLWKPLEIRHRLPFVLLLVVSLPALRAPVRRGGRAAAGWAMVVVLGALVSVAWGARAWLAGEGSTGRGPTVSERELAAWLDARASAPTVALVAPQRIAVLTERSTFHWIGCGTKPQGVRDLLERVPIELVVVRARDARCRVGRLAPPPDRALVTFGEEEDVVRVFDAATFRDGLRDAEPDRRRRGRAARRAVR